MALILSLDIGTTGLKTIIVNESGDIIKKYNKEYGMIQRYSGNAEQHPSVWWEAVVESFQEVLDDKIKKEICAIGVSGQFQSLIMLDKSYSPIQNAILWCDQRGEQLLSQITEKIGREKLIQITANPALSGSSISNLLWMKEHRPDIFEKCYHIMLPHEYIRLKLTGECVTDVTSASSMQLLNVPERQWSAELFDSFDLDRKLVGKLCESTEIVGKTTKEVEYLTGLPEGIPVVAGGGDSVVSSIGTGVIREGSCFTSIGTSGIICTNTNTVKIDTKGRVNTYCSAIPGMWSVITCSITAGFALKWLKNNFCIEENNIALYNKEDAYDVMGKMAEKVSPGSEGLVFLPYLMGDRTPHLNINAKGVFFGITSKHERADFIRSVMEGVAYSLKEGIQVFEELGITLDEFVLCGGGAKGRVWRNIIADVYGSNVFTVQNDSGSAIGAAVLAACGTGIYSNIHEASERMIKRKKEDTFSEENHEKYMNNLKIYQKIYKQLEGLF